MFLLQGFLIVLTQLSCLLAQLLDDFTVIEFLKDIQRLHGFESLLLMHNHNLTHMPSSYYYPQTAENASWHENKFVAKLMQELEVPVLQLDETVEYTFYTRYPHRWLAIVLIDGEPAEHSKLLRKLPVNFRQMTYSKLLFLLSSEESESQEQLVWLFQMCWKLKFLNVVALHADYQLTGHFFSYSHFPQFVVESHTIAVDIVQRQPLYPPRLTNLNGFRLPIILGGSEPRLVVYYDQRGDLVIGGFVGHFMRTFEKKFNCSLYQPLPARPNAFAPAQQLIAAVRNGTVEISLGITYPSIPIRGYSYPLEQMNWCISLPVEPNVPYYEFFVVVFDASAFALTMSAILVISMLLTAALLLHGYKADLFDFLVHDDCLRGVLGQSFSEVLRPPKIVRFIYLQICVLGILLTTTFNAYFSTYVTSPPKQPALRSYEDILRSGLKISAWAPEYNELLGRIAEFKHYQPMFFIEPNYLKYLQRRDSFDTRYGYMMPSTKWLIVQEQQKIFTSSLFRLDNHMCFFNNIPMGFPVHENSIFMQPLYQLMLETAQAGLLDYWYKYGFLELIKAGKLNFADFSAKNEYTAMKPGDLQYVWIGLGVMGVVTTLSFLAELLWFHKMKLLRLLRRLCCRRLKVAK